MLCIWRFYPVSLWLIGLNLLAVSPADSETLYHWEGRDGVPVYSNVSPPSDVGAFSEWSVVSSEPAQTEPPVAGRSTSPEKIGSDTEAEIDSGEAPDPTAAFLRGRIARREVSIRHIETLLKAHPDDLSLRKQLHEKEQTLREDLLRLELMTK